MKATAAAVSYMKHLKVRNLDSDKAMFKIEGVLKYIPNKFLFYFWKFA